MIRQLILSPLESQLRLIDRSRGDLLFGFGLDRWSLRLGDDRSRGEMMECPGPLVRHDRHRRREDQRRGSEDSQ